MVSVDFLFLLLCIFHIAFILKRETQIEPLPETIPYRHVDSLLVGTFGGIIQPERFFFQRVEIIGSKHSPVVHPQAPTPVRLEVGNEELRFLVVSRLMQLQAYFSRFTRLDAFLHGHGRQQKVVCLLHLYFIIAGGK